MPTAAINETVLYWQMSGQAGDPLVLVHGSWSNHLTWAALVPILARSYRVLSYDRRGHSRSERPAGQGSVREDVADLAALIEHLELAPAHILGNSAGGVVALRLAAERPELFRSLIVHEPGPLPGLSEDSADLDAVRIYGEQLDYLLELLETGDLEAGTRRFMEIVLGPGSWKQLSEERRRALVFNAPTFLDESRDSEWEEVDVARLAGFSRPALLTQGDRSERLLLVGMEELARALPQASRQILPGMVHVPHASHPEDYAEVIASFIATSAAP